MTEREKVRKRARARASARASERARDNRERERERGVEEAGHLCAAIAEGAFNVGRPVLLPPEIPMLHEQHEKKHGGTEV